MEVREPPHRLATAKPGEWLAAAEDLGDLAVAVEVVAALEPEDSGEYARVRRHLVIDLAA
jgi:hypothetical protein